MMEKDELLDLEIERLADDMINMLREFIIDEFTQKAESGKVSYKYKLSKIYGEWGDKEKELFWLEQAACSMKSVRVRLANLYFDGIGCEVTAENDKKAFDWLYTLIDSDNHTAINNIAWAYKTGRGCSQDYNKAKKLFEKATEMGSATAYYHLGTMYQEGLGVNVDVDKAIDMFKIAAEKNCNKAIKQLKTLQANRCFKKRDNF